MSKNRPNKLLEMESQAKPACKELEHKITMYGYTHILVEADPERHKIYPANYMGHSGFVLKKVQKIKPIPGVYIAEFISGEMTDLRFEAREI